MKHQMVKLAGGTLCPASDIEGDVMSRYKTNDVLEVEIKAMRHPAFHRKAFAFFNFCFDHWKSDREFVDERGQFDVFRKNLTVLAGYRHEYFAIDGSVRVEAKSLAYGAMDEDEFAQCFNAMVGAALRTIFDGCGADVEEELLAFF